MPLLWGPGHFRSLPARTRDHRDGERAQRRQVVSTFLHQHRRPDRRKPPARGEVTGPGHPQRALRIRAGRVQPDGYHQGVHPERRHLPAQQVERGEPFFVPGAGCQRQVAVAPGTRSRPALAGVPGVVREPARPGVHVQRAVPDIGALIKDHLCAVAVVRVDVDHRYPPGPAGAQRLGGDRGVVEVARAAVGAPRRVVTWWPAQRIGQPVAGANQVGRGQRGVRGPPDRLPASGADQRHRVVAEPAGPAVHGGRRSHRQPGEHPGCREHVGNDAVTAVRTGQARRLPLLPDPGQVVQQQRVVHGVQNLLAVPPRGHDLSARGRQRVPQDQSPGRDFGAGIPDAEPHLACGLVPEAVLVPHHRDRQAHPHPPGYHRGMPRAIDLGITGGPPPSAPASGGPDPYAWMRDRDLPAMRDYLAAERAYYDRWLGSVRGLRDELAAELTARVIPAEESVSWRRGGHTYFTRTVPGQEYEQFCRAGGRGEPAQVLLDENTLLPADRASGGYLGLGVREISPDGRLLAYSVDFDGGELYQLRIRDLASGGDLPEQIEGTCDSLAWSADSR